VILVRWRPAKSPCQSPPMKESSSTGATVSPMLSQWLLQVAPGVRSLRVRRSHRRQRRHSRGVAGSVAEGPATPQPIGDCAGALIAPGRLTCAPARRECLDPEHRDLSAGRIMDQDRVAQGRRLRGAARCSSDRSCSSSATARSVSPSASQVAARFGPAEPMAASAASQRARARAPSPSMNWSRASSESTYVGRPARESPSARPLPRPGARRAPAPERATSSDTRHRL
jgi:hypothetical protein